MESSATDKAPGVSELTNEQLRARRLEAFELHVVKRMTREAIAIKLGVSSHTVGSDIKHILKEKNENAREIAEHVKGKQDSIYEALISKWLPIALGDLPQGEHAESYDVEDRIALIQAGAQATATITAVLRDQAKLHGFHQPKPTDPKDTGKAIGEGMYSAIQRLAGGRTIPATVIDVKEIQDADTGKKATEPQA